MPLTQWCCMCMQCISPWAIYDKPKHTHSHCIKREWMLILSYESDYEEINFIWTQICKVLKEKVWTKKSRNKIMIKHCHRRSVTSHWNAESARSVIYAIFSAHSAYFNVSRQKVQYFNVSRQKVLYFNVSRQNRVIFNCFATKHANVANFLTDFLKSA